MDHRIPPVRPDVVSTLSAPRPTPTPARVPFASVLASAGRAVVAGAESAIGLLPGGPMMAVAIRGSGGVSGSIPMGLGGGGLTPMMSAGNTGGSLSPEGPRPGAPSVGTPGAPGGDGIQNSLQQAQEMNLYYLQIQEQVNQQNRVFSTLSNVMKAEHDTVKTAIGNIR
jgi:hypothetical protein